MKLGRLSLLINEAGANVIGLIDIQDKNPAVTDLAGSCCLGNNLDDVVNPAVVGHDLDHGFGEERYVILQTAINRGLPLLMAMTTNIRNSKAR